MVCRLNEENVVYPPQIPAMSASRAVEPMKILPSGAVSVAMSPMMNEPDHVHDQRAPGKGLADRAGDDA